MIFHSFWYVYQRDPEGNSGKFTSLGKSSFLPFTVQLSRPRPPTFGILQHSTARRLEASSWRLLKAASIGGAIFKQINKSTTVTGQSARLPISANADMIS